MLFCCIVTRGVVRNMKGIYPSLVFVRLYSCAEIDKLVYRAEVIHGNQYPFFSALDT